MGLVKVVGMDWKWLKQLCDRHVFSDLAIWSTNVDGMHHELTHHFPVECKWAASSGINPATLDEPPSNACIIWCHLIYPNRRPSNDHGNKPFCCSTQITGIIQKNIIFGCTESQGDLYMCIFIFICGKEHIGIKTYHENIWKITDSCNSCRRHQCTIHAHRSFWGFWSIYQSVAITPGSGWRFNVFFSVFRFVLRTTNLAYLKPCTWLEKLLINSCTVSSINTRPWKRRFGRGASGFNYQ